MKLLQNTSYSNKHSSSTVLFFFSGLFIFILCSPLSADAGKTITDTSQDFITDSYDSFEDDFFDEDTHKTSVDTKDKHQSDASAKNSNKNTVQENTEADTSSDKSSEKSQTGVAVKRVAQIRYVLRSSYSLKKGVKLYTGISHRSFGGFIHLESKAAAPYLQFSLKSFGVLAAPFADLQQKYSNKMIPHLGLATGSLSFNRFLKTMGRTGFLRLRANYAGIKQSRKLFIALGGSKKDICYGAELAGTHWNTAFFAVPEKKRRGMQYGVYGSSNFSVQNNTAMRIQHITAFLPQVTRKQKKLPYRKKDQQYHTISGLGFTVTHPNVSFETVGVYSVTADKNVSGAVKTEFDFFYRYVGLNSGFSYIHPEHFGWNAIKQKERMSAFVQPKLQFKPFVLRGIYAFYLAEKKKLIQPFHTYGVSMQTRHPNIRWYTDWYYAKKQHTVKAYLRFISAKEWFSGVRWFQNVRIGTQLKLEDKEVNPMIIKKYTVKAGSTFAITEYITCGMKGSVGRTAQSKRKRKKGYYWKPLEYIGSLFFAVKKHGINKTHSFKLNISGKNREPFYDVSIRYKIQSD